MDKYDKCIKEWNLIFKSENIIIPDKKESGNLTFDEGLNWVTKDSMTLLDFGCGSGTVLFLCSLYGTTSHIGIDLSPQAIKNANSRCSKMNTGEYTFICGGIEALETIKEGTIDSVILSNIVDNLYPEDANKLLAETKKMLKKEGKVLIKLNPYLTQEQIDEYKIRVIKDNLLDDGLILWNNTTKEWINIISQYFFIEHFKDIFYEEHKQYNRMFLARK